MYYGKHKKDGSFGFFQSEDACDEGVFVSMEDWKALMSDQDGAHCIMPNEEGYPELVTYEAPVSYQNRRRAAYPPMADFLDAQIKINSGDSARVTEGQAQMDAYVTACLAVKETYPKT